MACVTLYPNPPTKVEIGKATISWVATEGTYFLITESNKGYSLTVGWHPETATLYEMNYHGSDPLLGKRLTVTF